MVDVLAVVNWEEAAVFVSALVVALGGQKGLKALIVAWRGKRGHPVPHYMTIEDCERKHAMIEQMDTKVQAEREKRADERQAATMNALMELKTDVREDIRGVHKRMDCLLGARPPIQT